MLLPFFFFLFSFFVVSSSIQSACSSPSSDVRQSHLSYDSVSYSKTAGELRVEVSKAMFRHFNKYALFSGDNEAQVISGQAAHSLLVEGLFTSVNDSTMDKIIRLLLSNGAIAILLPGFTRVEGETTDVLYVPYPDDSSYDTGLSSSCNGYVLDLKVILRKGSSDGCTSCGRGQMYVAGACTCDGYLTCDPCNTSCTPCEVDVPNLLENLLNSCQAYTTCVPGKFQDESLVASLSIGSWL